MQVRALLAKLQAVFDLPRRLRTAIDQGAIEIAVNSYADAAPLLKRYGHKVGYAPPSCAANNMDHLICKAPAQSRRHEPDLAVHYTCTCNATSAQPPLEGYSSPAIMTLPGQNGLHCSYWLAPAEVCILYPASAVMGSQGALQSQPGWTDLADGFSCTPACL